MKIRLIPIFLLLSTLTVFAQRTIILKPIAITKAEFNNHLPIIDLIVKPASKLKSHGIIKLKTNTKTFALEDDGEMLQYIYEGNIKGHPIAVIHKIESNSENYYLINKQTSHVDTLLDKPIFYADRNSFICLEGAGTDINQRIQIGELKNNRFTTKAYIKLLRQPFVAPSYVFWYNRTTIFISDNDTKFYKIELKEYQKRIENYNP